MTDADAALEDLSPVTTARCFHYRTLLGLRCSSIEGRVVNMENDVHEIKTLIKSMFWILIGIAIVVVLILIGVILGRGFDFDLLVPH